MTAVRNAQYFLVLLNDVDSSFVDLVNVDILVSGHKQWLLLCLVHAVLADFKRRRNCSREHVLLKITFFYRLIWQYQPPITMLNASLPLTHVSRAIHPYHLSKPLPLVYFVFTFEYISCMPLEYPMSMFMIIEVFTFVLVAIRFIFVSTPLTLTVLLPTTELSFVYCAVLPQVLTITIKLSVLIPSDIHISIVDEFFSHAVF